MKTFLAVAAVVLLASHLASTAYVPYYYNDVAKMAVDNAAADPPEVVKDSAYYDKPPEAVKDSAYYDRPPEAVKDSAYYDRPPEAVKDSVPQYYYRPEMVKGAAAVADLYGYQPEVQGDTIQHGDTIALQTVYDKRNWLGCAPSGPCAKADCPGLIMDDVDWDNCWGEVFKIYRFLGPGDVRVGDIVGIYYPREDGLWLGCAADDCVKANCPGTPDTQYGMSDDEKWFTCWGEVYKIYAHQKSEGDAIEDRDHVTIYYLQGNDWIGLVNDEPADHRTCPGTTREDRPPDDAKYNQCWGEVFEIWRKP